MIFQQNDRTEYSIPEFLLPESSHQIPMVSQEDSDMEDEYEDDTTQGQRIPDFPMGTNKVKVDYWPRLFKKWITRYPSDKT